MEETFVRTTVSPASQFTCTFPPIPHLSAFALHGRDSADPSLSRAIPWRLKPSPSSHSRLGAYGCPLSPSNAKKVVVLLTSMGSQVVEWPCFCNLLTNL